MKGGEVLLINKCPALKKNTLQREINTFSRKKKLMSSSDLDLNPVETVLIIFPLF